MATGPSSFDLTPINAGDGQVNADSVSERLHERARQIRKLRDSRDPSSHLARVPKLAEYLGLDPQQGLNLDRWQNLPPAAKTKIAQQVANKLKQDRLMREDAHNSTKKNLRAKIKNAREQVRQEIKDGPLSGIWRRLPGVMAWQVYKRKKLYGGLLKTEKIEHKDATANLKHHESTLRDHVRQHGKDTRKAALYSTLGYVTGALQGTTKIACAIKKPFRRSGAPQNGSRIDPKM
jgi:hypothetical protein